MWESIFPWVLVAAILILLLVLIAAFVKKSDRAAKEGKVRWWGF